MWKPLLLAVTLISAFNFAEAQTGVPPASAVDLANLSEQVRALNDQVGQLGLRLEQVERENATLQTQLAAAAQSAVTMSQLNTAVAELNRQIQAGDQTTREQVADKIKELADKTNAAMDGMAKAMNRAQQPPAPAPTFSDDFPKDTMVTYIVQKGDSLDLIARKTGAKKQDIVNANKIVDPSKVLVGQKLLIPGGKPPAP